ncbi:glycoside hydrolase family 26 protein [Siansivirga zeaxanthinifaciens]|uniref:glycoside hydrolase family 26 protein n=1 Tax=Siansivirga zeaxanthinifaciens TaxID=762954 RepID=UPI00146FED0F|nr:glycosyl hydrolase [Siansivirga zeaxanthinifaciens]
MLDINKERVPNTIIDTGVFADVNLGIEAKDLFTKLKNISQQGIAFGQQAPFGTGNNFPVDNKLDNDFNLVTGDYPAIVGFDLELISLQRFYLDRFITQFATKVREAHENGSIITMSWHMVNPNAMQLGGDDTINGVVSRMLEGGDLRDNFFSALQKASLLFKALVDADGKPIPILFRPWHEMNGNFFFWGEGFRTTEDYIQLWRDTVDILSNELEVHNLLYVYAPNLLSSRAEYLKNYPGDNYVDILGIDVYDFKNGRFLQNALTNLQITETIAREKNKLFALTETGLQNVTQNDWWTESLYKAIRSSAISYTMIWRNDTQTFFYAPFLGHPSESNFRTFLNKDTILLSQEINP